MVTEQNFEGILVADETAMPADADGNVFLPTSSKVQKFEVAMESTGHLEFDPKEEVTQWWRVYAGYEDVDGIRHLVVQGDCADRPTEMSATVKSDGRCYWHAMYDLDHGEMDSFEFEF